MKDELINKIQPNCLLSFTYMALWLDSVILDNDPTGAVRQQIKSGLYSGGQLTQQSWELLINNVQFENGAPINKAVALNWIAMQGCPTCAQLKIFIQSFKINTLQYFQVQTNVLDIVELNLKTAYNGDFAGETLEKNVYYVDGQGKTVLINTRLAIFEISNFDLIKDAEPYLILERYLPRKSNNSQHRRKSGWKRDKNLMQLGGAYWDGFSQSYHTITESNMYRPNEILLNSSRVVLDLYPENYIKHYAVGNRVIPKFISGNSNISNVQGQEFSRQRVPMRARIGFKINGVEKISKPLIYFSIFAKRIPGNVIRVDVTFSK